MEFLTSLFDTSGFPPRWYCGQWTAAHGWLHILSDLGVWSAYVAIPCVLGYFILKRSDLPFRKIFVLFGAFILACGTTHLMEAIIFWWPAYRLAGVIKLSTALISWGTVVALAGVVPNVLKLRTPEALEREIAARTKAEDALHRTNAELQVQVESLRASEERFRLLVEGTKDHAIFLLDQKGNVASWNPGAERIKKYRAEEIVGKHFSCFYRDEDVQSGKPDDQLRIAAAQGSCESEGWRIRKDGTQFCANVMITALRDENGNLRGFSKIVRDITEKKRTEEIAASLVREEAARRAAEEYAQVIQRQREQLRVTLQSIGDAVIVIDAECRISLFNPVAEALTGWTEHEATGTPLLEVFKIVNEQTRLPVENPAVRAMNEGVIVGLANHTVLIAKDGSERPIDDSAGPIIDEKGTMLGVVLVFRDVTDRRRAEAELRATKEIAERRAAELDAVIEGIPDAVYFGTPDGITKCNSTALKMIGASSLAEIQTPLAELFAKVQIRRTETGEFIPLEELPFSKAIRGETVIEYLIVKRADTGQDAFIRAAAAPIRLNGQIIGAVAVNSDVTAQRSGENMNRLLADVSSALVGPLHYQSVLRHVAELTVPTLGDFCFFDVVTNDEQIDRVGWKHTDSTKAELSEMVRIFVPPKDADNHPIREVLRTGRAAFIPEVSDDWLQAIATSHEHLDFLRELNICSVVCVPMLVGERRVGTLTFAYSSSRRRHTPDDLRLAAEIARRTALTVENAKLFNQLRDADQKKNEFLAVLAHELRNPLAPITNVLEIMRVTAANEEELTPLRDVMERQVQQMVHLVDDLLDVSRITSGKIVLRKELSDLRTIVQTALETSRPLLEASKHDLTVTLPPQQLFVEGDKTRLAQVLSNLLTNAAKYTPEGGRVWLTVSQDGQDALIRVRDTGMGIPEDMLPLIFEMFTQVDRNLGRSQGGLGIGLTLVRSLVEMHGGTIRAFSDGPGQGSEFVVRLPLSREESQQQNAGGEQDQRARAGSSSQGRILVVDDNKDSVETLSALLRIMGYEVRMSYDGPSALEAAAAFRPHVVLLDIGLPGMSGYDVARRMRQMPEVSDAVLIAQTGWGQDDDKRRAEEAGFNAHMVKPVDTAQLKRLLAGLPWNST